MGVYLRQEQAPALQVCAFPLIITHDYRKIKLLSVILSARSTRSFLQSRKATEWRRAAKSRGKPQAARRRDLRTVTAKPSSDKRIVSCVETPIMGRGFVRTTRAARSARADASGTLRASQGRLFAPGSLAILLSDDRGGNFLICVCLYGDMRLFVR